MPVETPKALLENDYTNHKDFDTRNHKKFFKPRQMTATNNLNKLLGFDIETAGNKNKFVLAVFCNDDVRHEFFSKEDVVHFLENTDLDGYNIVATNLGFDFLGTLMEYKHQWRIMERNGTIYGFTWYINNNKKRKIEFIDSVRFYPASVEMLGKILKIPKMKHPACFGKQPKSQLDWLELSEYCYNDAYISYKFTKDFIFKYVQDQGLQLRKTCASISLCDFRTHYLKDEFMVESPIVHERVFKAYYGGRTEAFRRGYFGHKRNSNECINVFDINSLYPSVMLEPMPDPNTAMPVQQITQHQIDTLEGVVYIEAFQNDCFVPVLPLRTPDKLIFPTGLLKGYYTFVELRCALENGLELRKIGDGVIYTQTKTIFKDFILDKYKTRRVQQKNNDPMELMTKLIMNSLYGKFAFNYRLQSELLNGFSMTPDKIKDALKITQIAQDFFSIEKESDNPPAYSFPIWSCYITAYARIKLFSYLKEHQKDLLYCDTDSIFLNNGGMMETSTKLGDMKLEYTCKKAVIVRPKFYYTKYAKIKGVRDINSFVKFNKIMHQPIVEQKRFTKYRTAIRSKEHHKTGVLQVNEMTFHKKKLSLNDMKRQWSGDFTFMKNETSKPIHMTEEKLIEMGITEEFIRVDYNPQDTK